MSLLIKDNFKTKTLVRDIEGVLDHIINIFNDAKLDLKQVEEKVRIEKFHHYNQNMINKTMRDAKLFSSDGVNIYPKEVNSFVFEDNLDIYENRFITSLLLEIKKDLLNTINYNDKKLYFLSSGISFGNYGTNQIVTKYANDSFDPNIEKNFNSDLLSKINYLMDKDFYKRVTRINLDEVNVTNVLIEDKDYNACYRFYRKGIERNNEYKKQIISELKSALINDATLNKDKNKIIYKVGDFIYEFCYDEEIHLKIFYKEFREDYQFNFKIGLFNSYLIIKYKAEENIIMINTIEDVLEVLKSLITTFNVSSSVCPICHNNLTSLSCDFCKASYHRIDKNTLWLTNIFRIKEER